MQGKNIFDMGTRDPEEIIRKVSGNLIHPKVYSARFSSAYPELSGDKYDLALLPDPHEIYKMIESGEKWGSYERPPELRGFVEPDLLADSQRIPHECMGISSVAADALRANGIPARERFYKTRMCDGGDIIGHWVVEYFDGKRWVLKDPSVPHRNSEAHQDHFYAHELYKMALQGNKRFEEMRSSGKLRMYEPGDSERVREMKRKAAAAEAMVQDAYTLENGAPMVGKVRLVFDDGNNAISMGSDSPIEQRAMLFDAYGREFSEALEGPDTIKVIELNKRIRLVQKS